ncbi:MAG: hypothetical protein RMI89_06735 [Gloeomargarita sp. SKYBB_i_bin120]|nr:hypothetical protein [Gloeomargarita sp. SKYG98]MCS7292656.1 hypothetical protein [Gloeomargarita sp. SKYB120]MDW8178218.1 hypothetical protein [Gloeomargarita sp. SKYBB_i_bin120]
MNRLLLIFGLAALLLPVPAIAAESRVAQACATRRVRELPIPFADLDPNHWAFEAVMTLYYCGAYRGGIPRDPQLPAR